MLARRGGGEDNFATKEDLSALAARFAALENSSKTFGAIATGRYNGDGRDNRIITTGLT